MQKEYLYLAIIIGYTIIKTIPNLWKIKNIYKLFGYKRVVIKGLPFLIKKISPLDFLEEKTGFPLTFFNYAKNKTMWEQMRSDEDDKVSDKQISLAFNLARTICEKTVAHWPAKLNVDDFFVKDASKEVVSLSWELYNACLTHNLAFLNKPFKLTKTYIIHTSELCAKFGVRPSEYMKSKGLTDVEKYMIDEFFYNTLLEKENTITKEQNDAAKKRGRR